MGRDFRPNKFQNHSNNQNENRENQAAHNLFKNEREEKFNCVICNSEINFLSTALDVKYNSVNGPVHFDCILKVLNENENLSNGESLTYIGKGVFAVIQKTSESPGFKIVRKIELENIDEIPDWRKEFSDRIKSIETPSPRTNLNSSLHQPQTQNQSFAQNQTSQKQNNFSARQNNNHRRRYFVNRQNKKESE